MDTAGVESRARPRAWAAAGLGLWAALATVLALWPGLGVPAWPGASLGCFAVATALGPGPIGPKAIGTVLGSAAVVLGLGQVAVLWAAALVLPGGTT